MERKLGAGLGGLTSLIIAKDPFGDCREASGESERMLFQGVSQRCKQGRLGSWEERICRRRHRMYVHLGELAGGEDRRKSNNRAAGEARTAQ